MSPRVWIPGTPATQGNLRRGRHGGVYESGKRTAPWRSLVTLKAEELLAGMGDAGAGVVGETAPGGPTSAAIAFHARFVFTRPKAHYGRRGGEPYVLERAPRLPTGSQADLDKLLRAVLDALTGVAWVDDGQVVTINAGKEYGNAAGAELRWDVIA